MNPEDQRDKFIAMPHSYLPSSMIILKCLFIGETYAIPPEGTWVRIIGINVSDDIPEGSIVIVTYII